MHTFIRRALSAGALVGGVTVAGLALTTAPASADDGPLGTTLSGLASGAHHAVRAHVPVAVRHHQVTVLGDHNRSGGTGSRPASVPASSAPSSSSGSSGSGVEDAAVHVRVPVRVQHQQVTVLGHHNRTGGPARAEATPTVRTSAPAADPRTGGTDPFLTGDRSLVDVDVPVDLCGNQVTVIGSGNTTSCPAAGSPEAGPTRTDGSEPGQEASSGRGTLVDVLAPVTATGNQVTVIGDGNTNRTGTSDGTGTSDPAGSTGDATDTPTLVDVLAPVTGGGNQVTVLGDGNTNSTGDSTGTGSSDGDTGTGDPAGDAGDGAGSGSGPAGGNDDATVADRDASEADRNSAGVAQAASAATTGSLPATGAALGLRAILLIGLLLLLGGGLLTSGGRRARDGGRLHGRAVPGLVAWQDLERALSRP